MEELAAQLAVAEAAEAARAQAVEAAAASLSTPPEYLRSVVLSFVRKLCSRSTADERVAIEMGKLLTAVLQLPTVDVEHLDASLARLSASADSWLERTVGTAGTALLPASSSGDLTLPLAASAGDASIGLPASRSNSDSSLREELKSASPNASRPIQPDEGSGLLGWGSGLLGWFGAAEQTPHDYDAIGTASPLPSRTSSPVRFATSSQDESRGSPMPGSSVRQSTSPQSGSHLSPKPGSARRLPLPLLGAEVDVHGAE